MTRILIVDDHASYREGLRARFATEMGISIVGEAASADEGISKAIELKPDVVVMDIDMPGVSPFEAVRRIQELLPATRVIILSGLKAERQIKDALKAGVWGYALKSDRFDQLKTAIQTVMSGKTYYHPDIMQRIEIHDGEPTLGDTPRTPLDSLTPRERELFHLLVQGFGLKQAARAMNVQYKTADKHKVNLMRKLDVHDRTELVRIAYEEGVLKAAPSGDAQVVG